MAAKERQEQEAGKEARELERRKQRMSAQIDRSAEFLKRQRELVSRNVPRTARHSNAHANAPLIVRVVLQALAKENKEREMLVAVEQNADQHLLVQDEEDQEQRVIEMMYQEVTFAQRFECQRFVEHQVHMFTNTRLPPCTGLTKIQEKEMEDTGFLEITPEQEEWLAASLAEQATQESELSELRRLQGDQQLEREQEEWLAASLAEQVDDRALILPMH